MYNQYFGFIRTTSRLPSIKLSIYWKDAKQILDERLNKKVEKEWNDETTCGARYFETAEKEGEKSRWFHFRLGKLFATISWENTDKSGDNQNGFLHTGGSLFGETQVEFKECEECNSGDHLTHDIRRMWTDSVVAFFIDLYLMS